MYPPHFPILVMRFSIASGRRWEGNIKMDIKRNTTGVDWIYLSREWGQLQAVVKRVMKSQVSHNTEDFVIN